MEVERSFPEMLVERLFDNYSVVIPAVGESLSHPFRTVCITLTPTASGPTPRTSEQERDGIT
jgi:hypothetical protein